MASDAPLWAPKIHASRSHLTTTHSLSTPGVIRAVTAPILDGCRLVLLLSRDELSGWLGSMDRYNGGGDRPFWIEAHGGRTYTVDRKSLPEPITVDHLSVSILGGTQPDKLDSLLVKTDDDGLLARFLTVFPEPTPPRRPTVGIDAEKPIAAFKRLHSLQPTIDDAGNKRPLFIHLEEDARDALPSFAAGHTNRPRSRRLENKQAPC